MSNLNLLDYFIVQNLNLLWSKNILRGLSRAKFGYIWRLQTVFFVPSPHHHRHTLSTHAKSWKNFQFIFEINFKSGIEVKKSI